MGDSVKLVIGSPDPYGPELEDKMRAFTQLIAETESKTSAELRNVSPLNFASKIETNFKVSILPIIPPIPKGEEEQYTGGTANKDMADLVTMFSMELGSRGKKF